MTIKLIRRSELCSTVGLAKSTIYAAMRRGEFPRPIKIGRRAVAWVPADLEDWLAARRQRERETKTP